MFVGFGLPMRKELVGGNLVTNNHVFTDLLTTASFQLLFGKFYSYFSIKWVYLIAIGIFEVGSLICGVAPNSIALIIGRAIAGLGSAGIFSGALIIVAYSVPLIKRPMFTGFIGAMYGIASVAGPLLGGVFVSLPWHFTMTNTDQNRLTKQLGVGAS